MAHYNPVEAFETLKKNVSDAISQQFPIEGRKNTLSLKKVWVDDNKDINDIRSQQDAKLKERSWAVPLKAEVELRDNATGKVKSRQTVTLTQLPKITNRYTYIVGGNEYQVSNQFRLKSGVYTHIKQNGELASQWNLEKGDNFDMGFDPKSKKMTVKFHGRGGGNIALYPLLKAMGIDDDAIEDAWGKEIFSANRAAKQEKELNKFHKSYRGEMPSSLEEAQATVVEELAKTKLRPDSTKLTLGKAYDSVTGTSLLAGSSKILKVSRQEAPQDDRDSLEFKELHSAEDLIADRTVNKSRWDIRRKILNNVDKADKTVKDIIHPDIFGRPIRTFFSSTLAEMPTQLNPMSYLSGNRRTTIRGEGGIASRFQVTPEAKAINPSHLGFLDPIQSPESEKIGTTLQLAFGVKKKGKDLLAPAYDVKTGKKVWLTPAQALHSVLAYPDQYKKDGGKLKPVGRSVKVTDENGDTAMMSASKVDYVLASPKSMFDLSANIIPFLQSDQGNRTMVASKQVEQAVALKDREEPVVQVMKDTASPTFEKIIGGFTSHMSPVDGKVLKVTPDGIIIKDAKGKRHEVQLYNGFPMNDSKSMLDSKPLVAKGDTVSAGQTVADTNFTSNGGLALGKNLRVAYMPYKGYNFEDGIVISETAAKKLTSSHLYRENVREENTTILSKPKFLAEMGAKLTKDQADKLDERAVIKPGSRVNPGDVLIGTLRHEEVSPEEHLLGLFSKKLVRPVKPRPVTWEKDTTGTVTRVVKHGKRTTVYVKADEPAALGDKIVGRHGNKGIVTNILPDNEMPHTADGRPAEVLLNPTGIPSRINLGQVLELAASKIARKTGKPYKVNNFDPNNKDYTRNLIEELESHGLSDTEDMFDPKTGEKFKNVLVGEPYIYKLEHTAAKGLIARSRHSYDSNLTPQKGGPHGAQTMDAMGLYAMLAHNARANIREMQTWKATHNEDFWAALQSGRSIPPPQVPFVFDKFKGLLTSMGLDVQKNGTDLELIPITDEKVLKMSNGELPKPELAFKGSNLDPEKGGVYDPKVTGTIGPGKMGPHWSHFTLAERMPNPVFEKPIKTLLGLTAGDYDAIISSKKRIGDKTGPGAIVDALKGIDLATKEEELSKQIPAARGSKKSTMVRQLKYIRNLRKHKMTADEAYGMGVVPVMPPVMRPISVLDNGNLRYDSSSKLYTLVANTNEQLKKFDGKVLPEEEAYDLRTELYDGLKSLTLKGYDPKGGKHLNGIAETLAGRGSPKGGFFQDKMIGKRQDMSMRATIIPEPSLSLDEVGIPRKAAAEVYKPFVVQSLVRTGMAPRQAQIEVRENTELAKRALDNVVAERPLLLKRDPVLHKFGVQAFKPKIIGGKAIKIHPLATTGYNADFDGDKMSAFVPVSQEAVAEARKMVPSFNLFGSSTGNLMFKPTQESMLGLYKLTEVSKKPSKRFSDVGEAANAVLKGELSLNDPITADLSNLDQDFLSKLAASRTTTTLGRLLIYNSLPAEMRDRRILTDPKFKLDKRGLDEVLSTVAREHTNDFSQVADRMKDLGNRHSTGLSISLKDFVSEKEIRDPIMQEAAREEAKIRASGASKETKDNKIVELYTKAGKRIDQKAKARADASDNRMYPWVKSGARGKWDQYKQMVSTPLLVTDSSGRTVPVPIDRSYSEGLDIGSYWTTMHGARMGTISRVEGTWRPGFMGKQIMQATMDQMVVSEDCGTKKGIWLPVRSKDALGRYTVGNIKLGVKGGKNKGVIPHGTLVTADVLSRLQNNKVSDVRVRSPLKCSHGKGLCSTCYGSNEYGRPHPVGTNVGIIAAHALGEPATQLSMNAFHSGGVAGAKGSAAVSTFDRMDQLLKLQKTLPGSATLSSEAGSVQKVQRDAAGGWSVFVGGKRHYVPSNRELSVRVGKKVKKGDALSSGPKNPREMLSLVGMDDVQDYLVGEIMKVYDKEFKGYPLARQNTETFVRSMTNLAEVTDPGGHDGLLPGDKMSASELDAYNAKASKDKQVRYAPVLQGVGFLPTDMQEDWLARMQSRAIRTTVLDAAAEGWKSNVHSTHPIPGMAYGAEFGKGTPDEPHLY
jgi:DNA-directed RNA polymerase subunit beta'